MQSALIINRRDFTPCSSHCGALITLLRRAFPFIHIRETFKAAPENDLPVMPDLVLSRSPIECWAEQEVELQRKQWASAKILALLCDPEADHCGNDPAGLVDVDDFLFCPYQDSELVLRIKRLLKQKSVDEPTPKPAGTRDINFLVGSSEPFLEAVRKVGLLAHSKAPVIISGETGCGKELLARAIHYQSARNARPFIPVNCGALPDELFENEVFGHTKGAYTNATSAEKGLIAEAEGGTLFLDEVDALSQAGQIKLLRFLQSGEYRPLGSSRAILADVRVLAATNTDLVRRIELKTFREDLHYRLNVLSLSIPALRDRGSDVLELANHFLGVYAKEHTRSTPRFSDDALLKLSAFSWPGNVRELEGVIQRAIVLCDSEVLTARDLELSSGEERVGSDDLFRLGKSRVIVQFERNFIARLLTAHGGNISRAAKAAGKDRRSFQRLVNKYALDRKSFKHQFP